MYFFVPVLRQKRLTFFKSLYVWPCNFHLEVRFLVRVPKKKKNAIQTSVDNNFNVYRYIAQRSGLIPVFFPDIASHPPPFWGIVEVVVGIVVVVVEDVVERVFILSVILQELPMITGMIATTNTTRITGLKQMKEFSKLLFGVSVILPRAFL